MADLMDDLRECPTRWACSELHQQGFVTRIYIGSVFPPNGIRKFRIWGNQLFAGLQGLRALTTTAWSCLTAFTTSLDHTLYIRCRLWLSGYLSHHKHEP
jgi:hypothetical protein